MGLIKHDFVGPFGIQHSQCYIHVHSYTVNNAVKNTRVRLHFYASVVEKDKGYRPILVEEYTFTGESYDNLFKSKDLPNETILSGIYTNITDPERTDNTIFHETENVFEYLVEGDETGRDDAINDELIEQPKVDVLLHINGSNLEYTTYDADIQIGGFQFGINQEGLVPVAGEDSEAAKAEFMVSASPDMVIGFSFSGAVLPSGKDLIMLNFVDAENNPMLVNPEGLELPILSDMMGNHLTVAWKITNADWASQKEKK